MKHAEIEGLELSFDNNSLEVLAKGVEGEDGPVIVFGSRTTVDPDFAMLFYSAVAMYKALTSTVTLLKAQNTAFIHIPEAAELIRANCATIGMIETIQALARGERSEMGPKQTPALRLVK